MTTFLQDDFMPLNGTDFVEIYVSNSKQAAHYYKTAFGFQSLAYSGLETGNRDKESYVIVQDKIRIVLSSPLQSGTLMGQHIDKHGDGIKFVALWVDDAAKNYEEAIKFLDIAIKKTVFKRNKARLKYIEAQLYQELGKEAEASEAYRAVTKMNPDYKMAFNAKINSAGVFSGIGDTEKLKKELNKMLRDNKNFDFRDQIYFALGNLYFKEGNREFAVENYRKSVANSFNNQFQRALSAITLADIYFEDFE